MYTYKCTTIPNRKICDFVLHEILKNILFYKLNNSNDIRISGIEPSSVIFIRNKHIYNLNSPYSLKT